MKCPECGEELNDGALYVRGLGASLSWSSRKDVRFLSRASLEQIHLGRISRVTPRAQAIIDGWRCGRCHYVVFKATPT